MTASLGPVAPVGVLAVGVVAPTLCGIMMTVLGGATGWAVSR